MQPQTLHSQATSRQADVSLLDLMRDAPDTSMVGKLARFFHDRPNTWIDGRVLSQIAGCYAWRTRVADLRRPPYSMRVTNRQRSAQTPHGKRFTISEYRFEPNGESTAKDAAAGVTSTDCDE